MGMNVGTVLLIQILEKLRVVIRPDAAPVDKRKCVLCHTTGDSRTDGPGRLVTCFTTLWFGTV